MIRSDMPRPSPRRRELAERLRTLRADRGLTLAALAARAGVTKGFLSQVERGLKAPSIPTLLRMAEVLGVTVGALFENADRPAAAYSLVRAHERQTYAREGTLHGYRYEAIAYRKAVKRMEPFVVTPPLRAPRKFFTHDGDEMVLVLHGRVEMNLDGERVVLRPGDCLYFDSSTPHYSRSMGKRTSRTLVVVSVQSG